MKLHLARPLRVASLALGMAGCGRTPTPSIPGPAPAVDPALRLAPAEGPAIPPIPLVEGPLEPRVQYPDSGALIAARDSNFIFGSVGNGRATLLINGQPVHVHPNGAFLAYLPVPRAELPQYELAAYLGAGSARIVHPVRVLPPRPSLTDSGPLVVDEESIAPRGLLALPAGESVRVSVRAPRSAEV